MSGRNGNVIDHPRAMGFEARNRIVSRSRDFLDSFAQLERALSTVERLAQASGEKVVLRLVRSYATELQALRAESASPQTLAVAVVDLLDELKEFETWFARYSGRAIAQP